MKLYATITSERATEGQGGNTSLEILIRDENTDILAKILAYAPRQYDKDLNSYVIHWLETSRDGKETGRVIRGQVYDRPSKGKKQKGIKEQCGHFHQPDEICPDNISF